MGVVKVQNSNVITTSSSSSNNTHTITSSGNTHTIEVKPHQTTTIQISPGQSLSNATQVCLDTMSLSDVDVRTIFPIFTWCCFLLVFCLIIICCNFYIFVSSRSNFIFKYLFFFAIFLWKVYPHYQVFCLVLISCKICL